RYVKGKGYQFSSPFTDKSKDKANMRHVWQRIDEFLDGTEQESKSLAELNEELFAPPYGVKAGLLPIIYMVAYLVNKHELALYEQGRYKPYFTEDMLERFVKRPDEFEFQRFRITGLRASIFEQYSKVVHGDSKQRTLLELAKPLASFMGGLPEYTHKTRRGVSEKAIKVRNAFSLAKSPERLLFEEIPQAIGFSDIRSDQNSERMEAFSQVLIEVLRELKNAYDTLLTNQKALLAQAFNIDPNLPLADVRKILAGNCHGLENYTVDTQGIRALVARITKSSGSEGEWLENILMFLGNKPTNRWQDSDRDTAEYRLVDFSRRIIDLEKLRLHDKDRAKGFDGDFDVFLLRSIKKGGAIHDEVVAVDKGSAKQIVYTKEQIRLALGELGDKELMLGALAVVVDEFLIAYKSYETKSDEQFEVREAGMAAGEEK
ncbi:MAG: hypothetical protein GY814_17255, partial [Gammaproteobacteria bacterium]|nr:hypothetical protein [Gammaproteobacteria bacterium]